jgi:putative DNA primase/helicase
VRWKQRKRRVFIKDVSFLTRLLNGRFEENRCSDVAELAELSPRFQSVARRLLRSLPHDRPPIWNEFLAGGFRSAPSLWTPVNLEPAAPMDGTETPGVSAESPSLIAPKVAGTGPGRRVRMTCAKNLKPQAVDWLWSGRVPLGMITMFAGDPKLGKSYVTLAMAAALSRGMPLPLSNQPNWPASTILMSAEDDPARTILPRLIRGGADLARIHILESIVFANGAETLPSLRADIDAITAAATKLGDCRLIVVDPVSAYLEGVDDHRNAALRAVLSPLIRLAEQLSAAVVLVSHLSKSGSPNSKHRVLGSIAYVGVSRANFLFTADPDDPTGRRVLMLDNGSNIAPPAPDIAYMIEDHGDGAWIEWSSPAEGNTVESLRSAHSNQEPSIPRRVECDQWLSGFLAEGPRSSAEVLDGALRAGFSRDQVVRSKSRIGAASTRQGFATGGQWSWHLEKNPDNSCAS